MCGIVGYISKNTKSVTSIFVGLKKLEYRGYDSWGITYLQNGKLVVKKTLGKLSDEPINFPDSNIALGHTRWATHGGITLANSHPHFDCKGDIAIVHNGIVENYLELKQQLQGRKHSFVSETDTEVIAHLIEEKYMSGNSLENAVRLVFNKIKGLNAFVVIDKKGGKIIAIKTGSPLILGLSDTTKWVASDINALGEAKELIILEDGEMAVIDANKVEIKKASNQKIIDKEKIKMVKIEKEPTKGNFNSFLEKEIHEQPAILDLINQGSVEQMKMIIKTAKRMDNLIITACGSSFLASMIIAEKIMKQIKKPVYPVLASEYDTWKDTVNKKTLVLAITQSGETIDVVDALKKAKQKGVTTASIVNSRYSSIQRMTDMCQLLNCGVERSVVATKSFVAQMAVVDKALGTNLFKRIKAVKQILIKEKQIVKITQKIKNEQHIFLLGRGKMFPIALEGALKIKEVTYIHAEGMAGGELKHGALALVEKGTVCIALVSDESKNEILANVMEVKARGAMVVGIAKSKESVFDYFLPLTGTKESEQTEAVIWLQLLANRLCELRHLDPDKPRNLAKSVTVK